MRSGHTGPRDPRGGEETGSDRPGRHHRRRIAPRLVAPRFPVAARGRDAARQSRAEIRRHRGAAADSGRDRQASLCEADHGRGLFIPEKKHRQNGEVHHPLPIHAASARWPRRDFAGGVSGPGGVLVRRGGGVSRRPGGVRESRLHVPAARRCRLRLSLRPEDPRQLPQERRRPGRAASRLRRHHQPRARRPPRGNGGNPAYLPRQLQERLGRRRRLRPGRRGDVLVPGRRLFHGVRLGARRRLRTAALRPQGKESGPWVGFKQDGFSRKDGTTETQDRRRLALRAARKPVPVAAMRLRQHASRQPAVAGRTVAQARARGRNRQGGLEMSTEKEILALEDRRCAAMAAGDLASLEKLLHDELLYTHSSGVMDTKASWLLSMKSGKTRYKSVKCSGQQVRIFGDVALVTGRGHIEAEINGQPRTLRLMFLNAWAKTPQGWKFVAWQSTPQPV